MVEMNPMQALQHELQVRQQVIIDLQTERERIVSMVDRANLMCHRLRDEVIMVTAQTHGIVKALMLLNSQQGQMVISGSMLKKARNWILEKGNRDDLEDGDIAFFLRPRTSEELEAEERMRKKVEGAEKRIIKS